MAPKRKRLPTEGGADASAIQSPPPKRRLGRKTSETGTPGSNLELNLDSNDEGQPEESEKQVQKKKKLKLKKRPMHTHDSC